MSLAVRTWTDPIREGPTVTQFEPGLSLAEIAGRVPLNHDALRPFLEARINGEVIPREYWLRVRPKAAGLVFVTFHIPLHGGGGKGSTGKVLGTVAAIALIAAGMAVSFGALGPGGLGLLGAKFASGSIGATLLGAGLAVSGSLILQGLASPAAQAPAAADQKGTDVGNPIGQAGAANDFAPGAFLKRVIGTHKVFPQLVVPPFTDFNGDDQYVYAVYGLAGRHNISAVRVGEALAETSADFSVETREGTSGDSPITIVTDTRIEEQINLQVSPFRTVAEPEQGDTPLDPNAIQPIFHRIETKREPDKFRIDFVLGRGLAHQTLDPEEPIAIAAITLRVRFRRTGTSTWVNLPELRIAGQETSQGIRLALEVRWVDAYPETAGNAWSDAKPRGWDLAFTSDYWGSTLLTANGSGGYVQWEYSRDKIALYLLKTVHPKDRYEFEVRRSWPFPRATFEHATDYHSADSDDKIPQNPALFLDDLVIPSAQSIWDEYPIDSGEPIALIAIRARNRRLDRVSCVASGYALDWNGSNWTTSLTSNPAAWYRHVLRDSHNSAPVPSSLVEDAELVDWYDWCEDNGREVNAVVQGRSVVNTLQMIALTGWASPRFGAKHGIVIDRIREDGPVGMVTQRNASGFGFEKPFPDRPHALRVTFANEERDWEATEITVYDEGYNADGSAGLLEATRFEAVNYEGITHEDLVRERAEFDLRWSKYRSRLVNWTMDIEHLEFRRGDLLLLETDILGQTGGRGRIKSIETFGGLITALNLDEVPNYGAADLTMFDVGNVFSVPNIFAVGGPRGVTIRQPDGTLRTEEVDPTSVGKHLVMEAPFAMPVSGGRDLIEVGALVVTGPVVRTAREVVVMDIAPSRDLTADVIAVDYAPDAMYAA